MRLEEVSEWVSVTWAKYHSPAAWRHQARTTDCCATWSQWRSAARRRCRHRSATRQDCSVRQRTSPDWRRGTTARCTTRCSSAAGPWTRKRQASASPASWSWCWCRAAWTACWSRWLARARMLLSTALLQCSPSAHHHTRLSIKLYALTFRCIAVRVAMHPFCIFVSQTSVCCCFSTFYGHLFVWQIRSTDDVLLHFIFLSWKCYENK